MRFDDRLMTVLAQPAADPHDRAVRWRQLVDLVARGGQPTDTPLLRDALAVIREDRDQVAEPLRAAAARAIAALPVPFALVELFASDRLTVSAPLLAAARLDTSEWQQLVDVSDPETRSFISTLRPDLLLAAPAQPEQTQLPSEDTALPAEAKPQPSISELVAKIERLRSDRPRSRPGQAATPARGSPALFRWESGPSGDISWVEGAPRGPLVGRSIARRDNGEGVGEDVERAFAMRSPFRDERFSVAGEGPVAGDWKISGIPAFDPATGRFEGYRGIALREGGTAPQTAMSTLPVALADPDSLRELVHELKTPLNAIIGFAEIIDSQLLGPADLQYRNRAAEIVAQARLLLSAIDDLDFAAKLQADRDRPGSGTDLAVLLDQIATVMRQGAAPETPQLELSFDTKRRRCALEPALAERLVTRFCGALLSSAPDRSTVQLHLDSSPGQCLLWAEGRTGAGDDLAFGLRLVRGLARIAGGDLTVARKRLTLTLPEL